jgi:hypothetical protein
MSDIVKSKDSFIQQSSESSKKGIEIRGKAGDVKAAARLERDNLKVVVADGDGNGVGMTWNW